jgi:SAM-dependent methyltransferase
VAGEYRLYQDLASWWPVISPPGEYADEAAYLAEVFALARAPAGPSPAAPSLAAQSPAAQSGLPAGACGPLTVLDLGSGGGHLAVHLASRFRMTLVDQAEPMLAVSRRLNPGCAHLRGDMRTLRLGHAFDVVLVHDAAGYLTTPGELSQVVATAYAHCRPGGLGVFVPDHVADTFRPVSGQGGGRADGREARFTERTWDPDPGDGWVQAEYEFTLREADGSTEVVREVHRLGALRRHTWLDQLRQAGFEPQPRPRPAPDVRLGAPRNLFIGRRPVPG